MIVVGEQDQSAFCMRLHFQKIITTEIIEDIRKCEPRKNCCLTWYSSEDSIVLERISQT